MTTGRLARLLDLACELMDVRRHEIAHADPHQIAHAASRHVHHAGLGRQPVQLGDDAERLGELIAAAQRVQERGMDRVHTVVLHLEPVAREHELRRGLQLVARELVAVVARERGSAIGRPEVGEHQARELVSRIGALSNALFESAAVRLAGRVEASPVDVVHPAVIAAADPALHRDPELERRPPVRAVQVQDAELSATITEHHQILAQDAHAAGRGGDITRERYWLPETAEILAAESPRADLSQLRIRRGDVATIVAVEWTGLGLRGARAGSLHGTYCLAPRSEPSQAALYPALLPAVMVATAHRNGHGHENTGRGSQRHETHEQQRSAETAKRSRS
jgi:predicted nucleic acid-binding protein